MNNSAEEQVGHNISDSHNVLSVAERSANSVRGGDLRLYMEFYIVDKEDLKGYGTYTYCDEEDQIDEWVDNKCENQNILYDHIDIAKDKLSDIKDDTTKIINNNVSALCDIVNDVIDDNISSNTKRTATVCGYLLKDVAVALYNCPFSYNLLRYLSIS